MLVVAAEWITIPPFISPAAEWITPRPPLTAMHSRCRGTGFRRSVSHTLTVFSPRSLSAILPLAPYGRRLLSRLQALHPGLPGEIEPLCNSSPSLAESLIIEGLQHACDSQHAANIELGRALLLAIPPRILERRVLSVARVTLDLSEPWPARRLLEVLHQVDSALLEEFAAELFSTGDEELIEAGRDALGWPPAG